MRTAGICFLPALSLAALGLAWQPGSPAGKPKAPAPPATVEELIVRSPFIFRGTVVNATAKSDLLAAKEKAAVVRVDDPLRAPHAVGTLAGLKKRQPQVLLLPRDGLPALREGEQALFFTHVVRAGKGLVTAEVYRLPLGKKAKLTRVSAKGVKAPVADPEAYIAGLVQQAPQLAFQNRAEGADLVISGKVVSVVTAPPPPGKRAPRISEHSPHWKLAIVQSPTVVQSRVGGKAPNRVGILFPGSRDVRYRNVPRYTPQTVGVWNLRSSQPAKTFAASGHLHAVAAGPTPLPVYTALNQHDFYPQHATFAPTAPSWLLQKTRTLFAPPAAGQGGAGGGAAPAQGLLAAARRALQPAPDLQQVLVVNMVPQAFSDETQQDSEPFLAVHPKGQVLLGSAFTPSAQDDGTSPVYVSVDGGRTWALNLDLPAAGIADQTYAFGVEEAKVLYGSIITRPALAVPVVSTTDLKLGSLMKVIADMDPLEGDIRADQPFIQARSFKQGDRVYVGENNFDPALKFGTASLRVSTDGGKTFVSRGLERRTTLGQDAPSVRPSVARDGTVYVAFMSWRSKPQDNPDNIIGDVVVCRDDKGGAGQAPFESLLDPGDKLPGKIVARNRTFPWNASLGQERTGSSLSLAVDPNHSEVVYLAWADQDSVSSYTVHVRRSTDRGQTWGSGDVRTVPSATNPALAVADDGTVALLYQQLADRNTSKERWETHLLRSKDGLATISKDLTLARSPTAGEPAATFLPFMGDYAHLLAVGNVFYGVFSTANTPVDANFPAGVIFQRKQTGGRLRNLADTDDVPVSIDPFFFRVPTQGETSGPKLSAK